MPSFLDELAGVGLYPVPPQYDEAMSGALFGQGEGPASTNINDVEADPTILYRVVFGAIHLQSDGVSRAGVAWTVNGATAARASLSSAGEAEIPFCFVVPAGALYQWAPDGTGLVESIALYGFFDVRKV